jgi:hypothetical protein
MKRGIFNRKADAGVGMSFSMIFAIILMVFFVAVAVMVIASIIKTQNCVKVSMFVDDFKTKINDAWYLQKKIYDYNGILPSNIDMVCFVNISEPFIGPNKDVAKEYVYFKSDEPNMIFYPKGKACSIPYHKILHLDISELIKKENPYCFDVNDGRVIIKIDKSYTQIFVRISR